MSVDKLYTKEERKINGVFYTPEFLAQYLAKKVIFYWGKKKQVLSVFDPACGDGILLRSFVYELLNKKIPFFPKIFGIDKDVNAVRSSTEIFSHKPLSKFTAQFINFDSLFPIIGQDHLDGWQTVLEGIDCKEGFDISLSNPPWGADLNAYDQSVLSRNFALVKGQYDIYDLFIEVILNNVKEKGIYGLILPDSLFSHEQSRLRYLLTSTSTIYLIARLGEKIFNQINRACTIIIGRRAKAPVNHKVDCFRLSADFKKKILISDMTLEEVEHKLSHKVRQDRFIKNDNCIFDIDLKENEKVTFNKIQDSNMLIRHVVDNTRGAEISKKGIVCQCHICKKWMPYPKSKQPKCIHCNKLLKLKDVKIDKIIFNQKVDENVKLKKLKVGEDLYRFTSRSKSLIDTQKNGINYKDLKIYQGEKILVRKTGVGITASIDYENSITNQVVYMLKLKPSFSKKISIEFVLAILNSRAITYYIIKKHGENEWKSHPYLTQTMLINLPFPQINFQSKEDQRMIQRVKEIIKSDVLSSKGKNITKENDLIIERIVAHFFKLDKKDYKFIFETLGSSDQLIPIKRLLNFNYKEIFKLNGV